MTNKGKAPNREPASITPEALRVLLDAIQALTLVQSPAPSPARSRSENTAAGSDSNHADELSAPLASSANTAMGTSISATSEGTTDVGGTHIGTNVAPTHMGFHCSMCRAYNVGRSQATWYIITMGHQVGIFSSWSLIQLHVSGVAHACFRRYSTQCKAQQAYNDALAAGHIRILP